MEEIKDNTSIEQEVAIKPTKKKRFGAVRASLVCLMAFTLICGIIYPLATTLTANIMFPYEANGSIVEVTMKDGTKRVFGSELIGQNYEEPKYLFGRVNLGTPSNLSPESEEFRALVAQRKNERAAKLVTIGYTDTEAIPDELLTSSGSGLDPHISVDTAYFQIPAIVKARTLLGENITEDDVKAIIDKYTEGRFMGIFGVPRVNVLLVNLALDGEI